MQRIVHSVSCLLLALALVLTGPGGSGPAKGAMLVELCAGDSPRLIWLDAGGNPVEPGKTHAKCLDCLLFSAPLPGTAAALPILDPRRVSSGPVLPDTQTTTPVAHLRPIPRGPPAASSEVWRYGDPRPAIWSLHLSALLPLDHDQVAAAAPVTDLRATP